MTTRADEFETNEQLRTAYERQVDANKALVGKLSKQAFIDAGYPNPESTERQAIEKFGADDVDFTDSDAIAKFAKDTLGYDPTVGSNDDGPKVPGEPETPATPEHVDPATSVVADIRSDELDATASDVIEVSDTATVVGELMKIAIEHGEGNSEQIEAAMAAELQGKGFMPDQSYTGVPLVVTSP